MAKRRGRPRKSGPREKNGRIQRYKPDDKGTPELIRHKALAVKGGDPADSTNELDRLKARGKITQSQADVGHFYGTCYKYIYGPAHARAALLQEMIHEHLSSEDSEARLVADQEVEKWLHIMEGSLKDLSRQHFDVVRNTAVYDRYPIRINKLVEGLQELEGVL